MIYLSAQYFYVKLKFKEFTEYKLAYVIVNAIKESSLFGGHISHILSNNIYNIYKTSNL